MEMNISSRDFWETFPILTVKDGIIVSKRGDITMGWRLILPPAYSIGQDAYEDLNQRMHGAIRSLPPWMLVHRQDMFLRRRYADGGEADSFLGHRNAQLFHGREHLEHHAYLFLTLSSRASALRPAGSCGVYGLSTVVDGVLRKDVFRLRTAASEFIHRISDSGLVGAVPLGDEELLETLEQYVSLGRPDRIPTDRKLDADSVELDGQKLWTYSISESRKLPSAIAPVSKVDRVSSPLLPLHLSTGAAVGCLLDCEHIVNSYILTVPENEISQELERSRKNKVSMSRRSVENTQNAEENHEYQKAVHQDQLVTVKANNSLMVWCNAKDEEDTAARAASALSSMGITCTRNTLDNAAVWYSSVPGAGCELGRQSFRTAELDSSLCLNISESYQRGIPDGLISLCDRIRHIPVKIDFQAAAEAAGLVANYNAFILGASGSGKSFFTNHLVRSLYDAGEKVVIIDLGHSYKGLCNIINEESGGKDGIYMTWDKNDPISFDAFNGFEEWINEDNRDARFLRKDVEGIAHLEAILKTIWQPEGGWNSETETILFKIIERFAISRDGVKPVFNDLYEYIQDVLIPLQQEGAFVVNKVTVTRKRLDLSGMLMALGHYNRDGQYGFLYNSPNPKDLFRSRFTVFEVGDLKGMGEDSFYPQCILGIMMSFNTMMRTQPGWKTLVIEEAWQAIANNQMSGFLKELWKTARKHSTSAIMVTQELTDIMSSEVIKDTILQNSATKILLSQDSNIAAIDQVSRLFGLTEHEKAMLMSIGYGMDARYRYREVFVSVGGKYRGVFGTELSPQEGLAYESNMEKKRDYLKLAEDAGYMGAADMLANG